MGATGVGSADVVQFIHLVAPDGVRCIETEPIHCERMDRAAALTTQESKAGADR
jgi:hypothetical protein